MVAVLPWLFLAALVNARPNKRQESPLFLSLGAKHADATPVAQCDEVEVTFGGGVPPYTLVVWSNDLFSGMSEVPMDAGGTAIWSIQSNPMRLSLHLKDSIGSSAESPSLSVLSGTTGCYESMPVLRMSDQGTQSPPNNTASMNGSPSLLQDCRQGGPARCQFTASGQSGVYFQQALIGNVFANCFSNNSVKQTFSGSTTMTDNWSVLVGPQFGTPFNSLTVTAQISRGEARTVTQTFEWQVEPGQQTALVAVGKFNGIYGGLDLNYSNGTSVRLEDAVYFQSTGEKATVTRLDIRCGEEWPAWNATTATNGAVTMANYSAQGFGLLMLVLSMAVLS